MWKDSIRNIVVIFQITILRIVGFYVRRSALGVLAGVSIVQKLNKFTLSLPDSKFLADFIPKVCDFP